MIAIDGSRGEGGGQILRSALALSILTGKPFRLDNIRANRAKPGLAAQHLACVRAASEICGAIYKGGRLGSTSLHFEPNECKAGNYRFEIRTAGATALVLHTVFLPLALLGKVESRVTITGGTHNTNAPSFDFLQTTWIGYLRKLGFELEVELIRSGFYPRGGGEIRARISPLSKVRELHLTTRGELTTAGGFGRVADLPESIAKTISRRIATKLKSAGIESHIPMESTENGPGAIAGITFRQAPVATTFIAHGEKGKPSEKVADEAVEEALAYRDSGCPVDPHSADQLLLPLAFAPGRSEYRVSEVTTHLRTNIDTVKEFLNREIVCDGKLGSPGTVILEAGSNSAESPAYTLP